MSPRVELKEPVENSRPVFSTKKSSGIGREIIIKTEEDEKAAEFYGYERKQRSNADWVKGPGGRVERH